MTGHLLREGPLLPDKRRVPVSPTPVRDSLDAPSQSGLRRPLFDGPTAFESLGPVKREAKEVEGSGLAGTASSRSLKVDQFGFILVEFKTETRQAFR